MHPKLTLALVAAAALLTARPAAAQISSASASCTVDAFNQIVCDYSFSISGTETEINAVATGTWSFTYSCLHEKTGKANRKWESVFGTVSNTASITGSTSGTLIVTPPSVPTDLCATNKGPYTIMGPASALVPYHWSVEMSADASTASIERSF